MNFNKDILTLSRVIRTLNELNINVYNFNDISITMMAISNSINKENIDNVLSEITKLLPENYNNKIKLFYQYILYVSSEIDKYNKEIQKRKEHVIKLKYYLDDTEETLLKKQEKYKNIYQNDTYLNNFLLLSKNNINSLHLSIYESLILSEEISCNEMKESISSMLSFIDTEDKMFSYVEGKRGLLKFANFFSFVLDIFDDVELMYNHIDRKKKAKK